MIMENVTEMWTEVRESSNLAHDWSCLMSSFPCSSHGYYHKGWVFLALAPCADPEDRKGAKRFKTC